MSPKHPYSGYTFHEEQRFRQWWVWLLVYGIAALQWWGFIQQIILGKPWGNRPAPDTLLVLVWMLFGIGFPVFFNMIRLTIEVTGEDICIHFYPLTRRVIPMADIVQAEASTYQPIWEYGGWGIRGIGSRRAYNVSGNQGVELTLRDGRVVMVGSQRADEMERAIASAKSKPGL